jgi:hypothetical protein
MYQHPTHRQPLPPIPANHHAAPRKPSKHQPTSTYSTPQHPRTAARGKCSRLRSVQAETIGKNSTRAPLHTNGKPQQAVRVTQNVTESSGVCRKTTVNLQKWAVVVYIIGHNVNDIRPKMQETCQNERPPPFYKTRTRPKSENALSTSPSDHVPRNDTKNGRNG